MQIWETYMMGGAGRSQFQLRLIDNDLFQLLLANCTLYVKDGEHLITTVEKKVLEIKRV